MNGRNAGSVNRAMVRDTQPVAFCETCISLGTHSLQANCSCSSGHYSGFGGLEVACWPLVRKFAGLNPAEAVGFLRLNKNPQHVGGHGCLSVVIVVCCQVEVSATN
jgi:hypothetical protein